MAVWAHCSCGEGHRTKFCEAFKKKSGAGTKNKQALQLRTKTVTDWDRIAPATQGQERRFVKE